MPFGDSMVARGSRRIAALAVSAAMFGHAGAQAAVPAYPPFPTGESLPEIADWLRANTSVPLGAVVGVGADSVFALEPTQDEAEPPILRVSIRQEVIKASFAAQLGGRSAVMVADIDCKGHRVFQRSLELYAGNNRQGAVRRMGAANDWQDVPPGTFMDDVVLSVCDPNYQPLFPAGQVAQAAPPPVLLGGAGQPRSPATSLRPVRPAGPPIPLIAPIARALAPPPAAAPAAPAQAPAPAPTPAPVPAPVAVAVAASPPDGPIATQPTVRPVLIAPPTAAAALSRPAAAPIQVAQGPVAPPPAAPPPVTPPPVPARPTPTPSSAPAPVQAPAPAPRPATAPPTPRPPAPAPATPAPPRTAARAAALGLRPLVLARAEIGAYPSVDAAIAAWRAIAAAYPTAMASKSQRVELSTAGGVTRFRAFVVGFSSRGEVETFCRPIVAEGRPCRAVD